MSYREVSEIRDGMRIDWDMPIEMEDGIVLRCDIYRPVLEGKYPVIMTYGPYGKWLHFDPRARRRAPRSRRHQHVVRLW